MKIKFDFPFTHDKSFTPNLTTKLIYDHARICIRDGAREILEVGCGCGVISLGLAIEFSSIGVKFSLSDVSLASTEEAKENFKINSQQAEILTGSILTPWSNKDTKYDLIIDDISGIARDISEISPWFNKAPAAPGNLGIELLMDFLENARYCLAPQGKIIFPLLSLSKKDMALNLAEKNYKLTLVKQIDWPLPSEMKENKRFELICNELDIPINRKFGMLIGTTYIYEGLLR